jgi:hypothetical protein
MIETNKSFESILTSLRTITAGDQCTLVPVNSKDTCIKQLAEDHICGLLKKDSLSKLEIELLSALAALR